ncbi:hypothetical protein LX32DRAFT_641119 [Colletotrichum zoysiae]|uniref:Uncharacterized protein n=1 Tax=Colletotrichum zoysiae TaxID=1216348 RepID=A0AAD9HFV7_9PEZI|nr:hypothetical protein LX32DRAFT_641119 [Colletotrichum zoysiae]
MKKKHDNRAPPRVLRSPMPAANNPTPDWAAKRNDGRPVKPHRSEPSTHLLGIQSARAS